MNNLDLIIQLIFMVMGSGFLGYLAKWLHEHHKATKLANGLAFAQQVAKWSVARVATDASMPMGMRRGAVVHELQVVLDDHGYHFDVNRLIGLAEATYQLYKANGHKIVQPEKTPAPTVDNTPKPQPKPKVQPKPQPKAEPAPKADVHEPKTTPVSHLTNDELNLLNDYRKKKAANK